jgi:hypothetical protein
MLPRTTTNQSGRRCSELGPPRDLSREIGPCHEAEHSFRTPSLGLETAVGH